MAVRAPYVLETSRSNMYTENGTPVGPTTVYPGLAGAGISGAATSLYYSEFLFTISVPLLVVLHQLYFIALAAPCHVY